MCGCEPGIGLLENWPANRRRRVTSVTLVSVRRREVRQKFKPAAPVRGGSRHDYADAVTAAAPTAVRGAGVIVAVQGVAALVMAAVLVVRGLGGADQHVVNGLGTAVWFVLVGGGVLAAGCALLAGKRWGRGLAVFTQLLLLPVAWYMTVGSHRPALGIPVAIGALLVLALLFSPPSLQWASDGDQRGPANSANRGPDNR